jgi:hypothetical protein
MDLVLGLLVMSMPALALAAVITIPILMITCRQRVVPALLLYLSSVGMLVAWVAALNANMDWADRTGAGGSAFAGAGWFLGATAAAAGATYLAVARRRTVPSP